jgi:hypothetical protein
MSKRRRASELMFGTSHVFRPHNVDIYAVKTGTGSTSTAKGTIVLLAASVCTQAYMCMTSGSIVATLVGSAGL